MTEGTAPTPGLPGEAQGEQSKKIMAGFQPGEFIAKRYEVLKVLGRGGMGVVYLVRDRKQNTKVALKTLLPEYAERSRAIVRFEREVQLARKLNHPYIVRIHDAWRVENLLLYTMEYVEGRSLRYLLQKKGQFGLGSTARVLIMLSQALEHAHTIMVHRDLSPDNVMVTPDGKIKLLDFGLAKQMDSDQAFTMIGVNLGKIDYNAPEQQTNATTVDGRADIYSLGVMFYEMLTAQLPRGRVSRPLCELRPDLPKDCEAFLEKAMARDRDERFPDMRAFRHALRGLYEKHKDTADGVTPPEPSTGTTPYPDDVDTTEFPTVIQRKPIFRRLLDWWRARRS